MASRIASVPPGSGGSSATRVAGRARDGAHDRAILRMQAAGEHRLPPPCQAVGHEHGLGGRGRAVIHGGVGDLHAGQVGDLGLELEEVLQRALRNLGLVGRVAGEELGALDQVIDARRHVMAIGAGADEERHGAGGDVARGHGAEQPFNLDLAFRGRQVEQAAQPLVRRDVGEEIVDRARRRCGRASTGGRPRYAGDSASLLALAQIVSRNAL